MAEQLRPIRITSNTRVTSLLEKAADGPVLLEKDGELYALSALGGKATAAELYTEQQIEQLLQDDALDEEAETVARRWGWNGGPR